MIAVCVTSTCAWTAVIINEIHYNPDVKTEPVEFIELFNPGTNAVDLTGWYFSDGVNFSFPPGTFLASGGYRVVTENPAALQAKFGVDALGPWTGTLNNDGDRIVLRNGTGGVEDQVEYQLGFPWPTVGDPPGYSIELVNPAFDNDLAGNWRASVLGNPAQQSRTLIADHATWRYFKGLSEASSPTWAWRAPDFDDSGWPTGAAPIGYDPALAMGTYLDDMRSNYTTVFFRTKFVVDDPGQIGSLTLEALYDDGFKVWINGTNVLNVNISTGEVPFDGSAGSVREDGTYNRIDLTSAQRDLVPGTNSIAIQAANSSLSASSDFFLDLRLLADIGLANHGPTPGAINSVYATNLPPAIRQVEHSPDEPLSGQPVRITAKVTDPEGVAEVTLQYQMVDPGNYIELTDAAYTNNWTSVPMNDRGTEGDAMGGDSVYTAVLPGPLQTHRRLVRYRIRATDGSGLSVTVPYGDDPQPNFAYFVYDGVPAWTGAVQPGVTTNFTVSAEEMNRLPVYQLISKRSSVLTATGWNPGATGNKYGGDDYLWLGTLVYDGRVYDHIRFRARGGVWRYAMGKNAWKFRFNRGHDLQARDDWGGKIHTPWRRLSFRPDIQQGDYLHRGEQGMFESVGYKLFRLAGVDAPLTTHIQFRIIDDAAEAPPGDQFGGDFWGLYLVVEEQDGRFLDERGLPDGNVYDMEAGTGTLNNVGPDGPLDKSDLNAFLNTYNGAAQPDSWWRANLNLPQYYDYQAILQGIHHYDIADGKNYFYYRNPVLGQWEVWPWDLDLSWADNMYRAGVSGGDEPFKSRVLSNFSLNPAHPALALEFRNRVREIRDLLFNTDQAYEVVDEMAALIRGPADRPSIIDADRAQWDYNPVMTNSSIVNLSKAGQGRFYRWPNESSVSKDFNGCLQLMKNYIQYRATSAVLASGVVGLDGLAADALIPAQPAISATGPTNFPLNRLTFRSSSYSGSNPFTAIQWRIGEVTDTNAPAFDPTEPHHYEITAAWVSDEMTTFNADVIVPSGAVKVGHAYRARVRMKDNTGRWSHWSAPVKFVVGLPDNAAALADYLRVTELMFDPPGGSEFEFIELHNLSQDLTLDLDGATFTSGVDYTFGPGSTVPPGGYLLVAGTTNVAGFRAHYGLGAEVPLTGPYSGSLANGGEQLTLKTGAGGAAIVSFSYGTGRGWPISARGGGHSLVPLDRALAGQGSGALDYPGNWRASAYLGGSPGRADPPVLQTVVLNEIVAHTDYYDPARPEYDSNDWIELYNPTATNLVLSGWYLSDDPVNLRKWAIPPASIPGHGWISFDEVSGFHNPITSGFGLDKAGEQVLLSYLPGTAGDRVADAVQFAGQENGFSLGRYPDGGDWFTLLRTRDGANGAPPGHVVISEVMYHPPDSGTNDNVLDEYVELFNPTGATANLYDTNGTWRIGGGIDFSFPANTFLSPGGYLLVVHFDPTDAAASDAFRARYGLTDSSVALLGPCSGRLANRSERVALEKPQYPDLPGEPYSWVIVDEVIYGNQQPWPEAANGGGDSLQRTGVSGAGNDPINWMAATPSPGRGASPDRDGDGMPDDWETAHQLNPDDPGDATIDSDGDGFNNLQEYLAGTDPRDSSSLLRFESEEARNGMIVLQFTAVAGKSYSVMYRDTLGAGAWLRWKDIGAQATTVLTEVLIAPPPGNREGYCRLVTPATP